MHSKRKPKDELTGKIIRAINKYITSRYPIKFKKLFAKLLPKMPHFAAASLTYCHQPMANVLKQKLLDMFNMLIYIAL